MNLWKEQVWTPMLLEEIAKPFDSKDYLYELKFDGIRAVIFVNKNTLIIKNRHNKTITNLYPELGSLKENIKKDVIFDGEIVMMDKGKPSFSELQKRAHLKNKNKILISSKNNPIVFICFDILYENKNLIDLPLLKRKEYLEKYPDNDVFVKSKYIFQKGCDLFKSVKKLGLEGIVAKKASSSYLINTRSDNWVKIKNIQSDTFYIGGYIEKENNNVISLLLGEYKNKEFYYVGKVVLGKRRTLYQKIKKERTIKKSPFNNYHGDDIFLKPTIKCRVNFLERTANNSLRQPFIP